MINNVPFLWKQLNGPQIVGITKAIFEFIRNMFEGVLNYFNYFSRRRCSIQHAEIIGMFTHFTRPILEEYNRVYFFFTHYKERNADRGFSEVVEGRPGDIGGKFSSLTESVKVLEKLDATVYIELLNKFLDSRGDISSLEVLDDVCHQLVLLDAKHPDTMTYSFSWEETGVGGLTINVGSVDDWNNPDRVVAVLNALGDTMYFPNTIIDVAITTN